MSQPKGGSKFCANSRHDKEYKSSESKEPTTIGGLRGMLSVREALATTRGAISTKVYVHNARIC